jgi:hypothetical protein
VCPASGNGNPCFRHIHEKNKIKEKRIEQEGKVEQNRTEQNRTERKHTSPQDLPISPKITPRYNLSL